MSAITVGWILMGLGVGGVFLALLLFYFMIIAFVRIARRSAKAA